MHLQTTSYNYYYLNWCGGKTAVPFILFTIKRTRARKIAHAYAKQKISKVKGIGLINNYAHASIKKI